ncbi:nucleotide sugar dehydrogenase [Flavihumibacter sp. UBA7668]|uniref:nucleotide sugar dehydrogenase n=1 Tax=Flavihumibacter sp. UBA7668 TaxID=1946542 RepID=UPI0025C54816|nr:nucleotide sugar dehydrogenase [Flavihumibacter sp. UBA7668]
MNKERKVAVLGLGYVGLPLAVEFAKKFPTVGFDINEKRVQELKDGTDNTLEVSEADLASVKGKLLISATLDDLKDCTHYIVTVPTPVDKYNQPDLTPLKKASETVGKVLKKGDIVIYESTVYPGVTEDYCVPVLEKVSGLLFNTDFFAGYSPERINPGDKERTLTKIRKITSGSTPEVAAEVNDLYSAIIVAGTFQAASIKVAEAAKVIENAQRDINIAFVNELAKIFNRLHIDTRAVLEAAGTKWNFLPFQPGLVGGHCIGVDPYYLAQKAQETGYHPEIILAGRRINDGMGEYVVLQVIRQLNRRALPVVGAKVLVLGLTFKENCPDIRNTKVVDIIHHLQDQGVEVDIYDPWASKAEVVHEYGYDIFTDSSELGQGYDGVILAVAHKQFLNGENWRGRLKENGVLYDVKAALPVGVADARL